MDRTCVDFPSTELEQQVKKVQLTDLGRETFLLTIIMQSRGVNRNSRPLWDRDGQTLTLTVSRDKRCIFFTVFRDINHLTSMNGIPNT